jgi:hypothetical protein
MPNYPAGVDGRLDKELFLLVAGKEDGFADERFDLVVITGKLDVGFVVLLEELGGEVAQTERYLEGGTDGGEVGLLAFLG